MTLDALTAKLNRIEGLLENQQPPEIPVVYVTSKEAARLLGVSTFTVNEWRKQGLLTRLSSEDSGAYILSEVLWLRANRPHRLKGQSFKDLLRQKRALES